LWKIDILANIRHCLMYSFTVVIVCLNCIAAKLLDSVVSHGVMVTDVVRQQCDVIRLVSLHLISDECVTRTRYNLAGIGKLLHL